MKKEYSCIIFLANKPDINIKNMVENFAGPNSPADICWSNPLLENNFFGTPFIIML